MGTTLKETKSCAVLNIVELAFVVAVVVKELAVELVMLAVASSVTMLVRVVRR